MIVVKATYTVKSEYVNTNKELIQIFLNDFKKLDNTQFIYSVFQMEDTQTFMHLSLCKNKEIQKEFLSVPSFVYFQEQRDQNLQSEERKLETPDFIGSSKEVL